MIKLNFIPRELRRKTGGFLDEGFGQMPREVFLGILIAAALGLLLVHGVLALVAVGKWTQQGMLQVQWSGMAADKKVIDEVTTETRTLQTGLIALRPVTSARDMSWGRLLNQVSVSVPRGLWLRTLRYQSGRLTLEGSSISKARNEMIIVNNYVTALRSQPSLREYFTAVDVDSIARRDGTPLAIADFSIKAQRKGTK